MKGELIPTVMYAEGRPRDVGTDRALANALNVFVDRKSARNTPWLTRAGIVGEDAVFRIRPIFFGTEHLSATVERFVTIAPWIRSSTGGTATFTARLLENWPTDPPAFAAWTPSFIGKYSEVATWSTTSTTWAIGDDATLSLGVKQLALGYAFLLLECAGLGNCMEFRGLSKCIEGVRIVS